LIVRFFKVLSLLAALALSFSARAGEQRLSDGILTVVHDSFDTYLAHETIVILRESLAEYTSRLPAGNDPITVYLCRTMQEFKARAGAYGQARVGGVAKADTGVIIAKTPALLPPHAQFRGMIRHELIHVLLARNTEAAFVPRWFDEGIAMVLSKEMRWESSLEVARMYVQRRLIPYIELNFAFAPIGDESTFGGAYAQALSMTRWLIKHMGEDRFWQLVQSLRAISFEDALHIHANLTPAGLDDGWRASLWKVALIASLVSGFSAFQLMAFLAVVAYVYKWRRGRRILRQWEEEEGGESPAVPWESAEEPPSPWEEEDDDDRKW